MFLLVFFFFSQAAKGIGAREWTEPESFIVSICSYLSELPPGTFFLSFFLSKHVYIYLLFYVELKAFSQSYYFSSTFILLPDACTTMMPQRLFVWILIKADFSTRTIYPICPLTCLLKILLSRNCKGIAALFDSMRLGSSLSFFFFFFLLCFFFWAC